MSLEIAKIGDSWKKSVLDGVKKLSDPNLSVTKRFGLIKEAACQIADDFERGSKTEKERRLAVNNLRALVQIDEGSRTTEVNCASGLMATLVNLSNSENPGDEKRLLTLGELITVEMGFNSLLMVDCEWCKGERLASYIGQLINKINRLSRFTRGQHRSDSDLSNQEYNFREDLDRLLTTVSERDGTEGDEDLAEVVFAKLNEKDRFGKDDQEFSFKMSFILSMARDDWPGAVEFLKCLDMADLIEEGGERVDMEEDDDGEWGNEDE